MNAYERPSVLLGGEVIYDPQIDLIDRVCSHKQPIRLGDAHGFNPKCHELDPERVQFLKEKWTGWDKKVNELRSGLLKFGGSFALIPEFEEDLGRLLPRGQLWGPSSRMLTGERSRCHTNSIYAWEANQDKLFLATGYALSEDGLWRQHSWCINPRPRSIQVIETTVRRSLYFGFVMTLEETALFADLNTDMGVEIEPATYERYGLPAPHHFERQTG